MCALRAHIKLSIFKNIFLKIEKIAITFSILEKFFSKNRKGHTLVKSYYKMVKSFLLN